MLLIISQAQGPVFSRQSIMVSYRETFGKTERLCSKKTIAELFEKGRSFYSSQLQVIWMFGPDSMPGRAMVAFSVSKKTFRNAVTRNLIKRRLREAYRKQKHLLYEHMMKQNRKVSFFIIFKDTSVPDYETAERSVRDALNKLIRILNE